MTKLAPALPIEVDSETGVWTSDALPMLYVPRHFFINNHVAVEEALGAEVCRDPLPRRLQERLALVRERSRMPWDRGRGRL